MKNRSVISVVSSGLLGFCALIFAARPAAANSSEFKSPASGMHFTEGEPLVFFADLTDSSNDFGLIICPKGQTVSNYQPPPDYSAPPRVATCSGGGTPTGWPQYQLLIDSVLQTDSVTGGMTVPNTVAFNHDGNSDPIDMFRFVVTGVAAGPHQVVARGLFSTDGVNVTTLDSPPISITVDPMPAQTVLQLTASNSTGTINWNNVIVVGNGQQVNASGALVIKNSLVTGVAGISGTVTSADIEGSTFEDTGELNLTVGTGTVLISGNEWRANNRLTFVPDDPSVPFIIQLSGSGTNQKLFQANRIAAGQVGFGGKDWLIGGDTDAQSNILMGPRCVLNVSASASRVVGNYDHHNYRGAWSQGFNFYYMNAGSDVITEHNFIRDSSWPLQYMAGEFRYNVVYGYGHTWVRTTSPNTSIHHNVFTPGGDTGLDAGVQCYGGETGMLFYNNTFDGGGNATGMFPGPFMNMSGGSQALSLRNNLFTFSRNQSNGAGLVSVIGGSAGYQYADYNAFYSPDNSTKTNYDFSGAGAHDVSGTGATGVANGQLAATPFAGARITTNSDRMISSVIDEAAVWGGTQTMSYVLAQFRARYMPATGSPIIDAGDPQDTDSQGRRADIGAIDADGHDLDKLGKFGTAPTDTTPPTATLTAPQAGATLTGTATVSATAQDNTGGSGVVLVQFQVDGATVAQATRSPYTATFDSSMLVNGQHAFSAKAWDAAGNFGVSAVVMASSMNVNSGGHADGGVATSGAGGSGGGTTGIGIGTGAGGGGAGSSGKGLSNNSTVTGGCSCSMPGGHGQGRSAAVWSVLGAVALALRLRRGRRR